MVRAVFGDHHATCRVGINAHGVIATQPDLVDPPKPGRDRRQRQHRSPVSIGGERAAELGHSSSEATMTTNPGLVVPDQPSRHPPELLDQRPRPQQQIRGLARWQHPTRDESRIRGHHHQHRQQRSGAVLERNLLRREPQIALRSITRIPRQPISWVRAALLRTQTRHVLTEPRRRTRPPNALREHRCRHLRELGQHRTHTFLERCERRRVHRRPLIARWLHRRHRPGHRVTRNPQPFSDLRLGHPLRSQPSNQRPVFQGDHTPIIECSPFDRQNCSEFSRHRHGCAGPKDCAICVDKRGVDTRRRKGPRTSNENQVAVRKFSR